jgi:elongation factor Ts
MTEINAAAVKALREKTGLPMMDCKRALLDAEGDQQKAIELLRKAGKKTMQKRVGRETSAGRIAVYADFEAGVGAMIDLRCESAPVAANQEFVQLAADLAQQLATGPGADTPEELLSQPSPGKPGLTLKEQFDELNNRIREVFRLQRITRIDGPCSGYAHHNAGVGVLVQVEGGSAELAKDVCMHIAAMRPKVLTKQEVAPPDPAEVQKEREILAEVAEAEGKSEELEEMVDDWVRNYYAQRCLCEQAFVKDTRKTIGEVAQEAGMRILGFVHWELAKE